MKNKIIILLLIIILVVIISGCNSEFKNKGKLIYKSAKKLEGSWQQEDYISDSKFVTITKDNIKHYKNRLRNIEGLSLNDELAVYVTLGQRPTGGYNIQIREIRKNNQTLIVTIKAVSPAADQMVTQVITYPYDLVRLSSSEVENIQQVLFYSVTGQKIKEEEI